MNYACVENQDISRTLTEIPYSETLSITGLREKSCELHLLRKIMILSLVISAKTLLIQGFFSKKESSMFCVLQKAYRSFISQASIETIHLLQSASIGTIYLSLSLCVCIYIERICGRLFNKNKQNRISLFELWFQGNHTFLPSVWTDQSLPFLLSFKLSCKKTKITR